MLPSDQIFGLLFPRDETNVFNSFYLLTIWNNARCENSLSTGWIVSAQNGGRDAHWLRAVWFRYVIHSVPVRLVCKRTTVSFRLETILRRDPIVTYAPSFEINEDNKLEFEHSRGSWRNYFLQGGVDTINSSQIANKTLPSAFQERLSQSNIVIASIDRSLIFTSVFSVLPFAKHTRSFFARREIADCNAKLVRENTHTLGIDRCFRGILRRVPAKYAKMFTDSIETVENGTQVTRTIVVIARPEVLYVNWSRSKVDLEIRRGEFAILQRSTGPTDYSVKLYRTGQRYCAKRAVSAV